MTTSVTVTLAFLGYLITFSTNKWFAKRKDKLDRINKQLGDFYGPLYSLLKSNHTAWEAFRKKHRPMVKSFFDKNNPPSKEDINAWRHYMQVIFMPNNEKIYDIIVSKSDLLADEKIPECLLELISHILIYRTVIKKWDVSETNENLSINNFPRNAQEYIYIEFEKLKKEQYKLIYNKF